MAKVIFNWVTKQIEVNVWVTSINVEQDLYSDWKEWAKTWDNLKYLAAFRTFGWDTTVPWQSAPKYFFLTNWWRVLVDWLNLVVASNLYTDEQDSPFILQNNASVSLSNSDVPVVQSELEQTLDYGWIVYYDAWSWNTWSGYPNWTSYKSVNNLTDALVIADRIWSNNIIIRSNITLDQNISWKKFYSELWTLLFNANWFTANGCIFERVSLDWDFNNSDIVVTQSNILNPLNIWWIIHDSHLNWNLSIKPNWSLVISRSASAIPWNLSPVIDMQVWVDTQLSLRAYSWGIRIDNCDTVNSVWTLEFVAWKANITTSCTDWLLSIRWIPLAALTDDSNWTTVDITAVILSWSGGLTIDEHTTLNEINTNLDKTLTTSKFIALK